MVTSLQGANNTGKCWKLWYIMSLIPGSRTAPITENAAEPVPPPATRAVPRTRFGTAWMGRCVAAVVAVTRRFGRRH
jgi:hypothetical protein